jgi:hypothetical protein
MCVIWPSLPADLKNNSGRIGRGKCKTKNISLVGSVDDYNLIPCNRRLPVGILCQSPLPISSRRLPARYLCQFRFSLANLVQEAPSRPRRLSAKYLHQLRLSPCQSRPGGYRQETCASSGRLPCQSRPGGSRQGTCASSGYPLC